MKEGRSAFKMFTGKHTRKRLLRRPRRRWVSKNLKIKIYKTII